MKTVRVKISPKAEVEISTSGFSGSACQDATAELERKLGVKTEETLTEEFYQDATSENLNQQ